MWLSVSDTEVGATFFVSSPSLLRGVSGTSAGILFQIPLFPFSVAGSVLSVPFVQGPLSPALGGARAPPVGGLGPALGRAPSPALGGPPLLQESLQRPSPPAGGAVSPAGGWPLSPPLRRDVSSLLVLLPPLQSVVGAAGALPPLLWGPPLGAVGGCRALGLRVPPSLRRPVLGSACPAVGFPRSPIPGVVFIGLSAILSAAFRIPCVCPLFPMWWWFVKIGWVTGLQWRMLPAVGPGPHFRNTLWTGWGAVAVAAGVCQENKREQQLGMRVPRLLSPLPPTLETSLVTTSKQLLKQSDSKPTESC